MCLKISLDLQITILENSLIVIESFPVHNQGILSLLFHVVHSDTNRLDAVAVDAELQEKSLVEMKHLASLLHNACHEAGELYHKIKASSKTFQSESKC